MSVVSICNSKHLWYFSQDVFGCRIRKIPSNAQVWTLEENHWVLWPNCFMGSMYGLTKLLLLAQFLLVSPSWLSSVLTFSWGCFSHQGLRLPAASDEGPVLYFMWAPLCRSLSLNQTPQQGEWECSDWARPVWLCLQLPKSSAMHSRVVWGRVEDREGGLLLPPTD